MTVDITQNIDALERLTKDLNFTKVVRAGDDEIFMNWMIYLPMPAWIRNADTMKIVYINPAFAERYDINLENYYSSPENEAFPGIDSELYTPTCDLVKTTKQPHEYYETDTMKTRIRVIKWPVLNLDGSVKYIGGMILDFQTKILTI